MEYQITDILSILDRLKDWYEEQLSQQQNGFRSARGTTDGIYITKRLQQISKRLRKPIYAVFVDLTAAFDHINRGWLFKSIAQRFKNGANDPKYEPFSILESLYSSTTTALPEAPDNTIKLVSGVRQGGPESPCLYNLYMDYVMRVFMTKCLEEGVNFVNLRYRVIDAARKCKRRGGEEYAGDCRIDWTGFADDLLIAFENGEEMQKSIMILDEVFRRFELKINVKKTKSMCFNYPDIANYPSSIITLNNEIIENVNTFRYLGNEIQFDQPNTGQAEINLRIRHAEGQFSKHRRKFTNQAISLKTRVLLFNSLVRSRLVYGCQTWNIRKSQMNQLDSFYCNLLRRLVKNGFKRKNNTELPVIKNEVGESYEVKENKGANGNCQIFKLDVEDQDDPNNSIYYEQPENLKAYKWGWENDSRKIEIITRQELEIRIPFDNLSHQNIKLKPQDFAIEIAKNKLTAGFKNKPPILDSELPHPIKEDDSFWWVDDNVLIILLAKIDQQNWWKNSLVGEFEINTRKEKPENSNLSDPDAVTEESKKQRRKRRRNRKEKRNPNQSENLSKKAYNGQKEERYIPFDKNPGKRFIEFGKPGDTHYRSCWISMPDGEDW